MRYLALLLLCTIATWAQTDWADNGQWQLRSEKVELVETIEAYRSLPWETTPPPDHFAYVERQVFSKKGKVALVSLTLKNPESQGAQTIGSAAPMWTLRCDDGQELRLAGVHATLLVKHLKHGLPEKTTVAPGKEVSGTLGFFLPHDRTPRLLFFQAPGVLEKKFGPTESLVAVLDRPATSRAALAPNREGPWTGNDLWKMRLNGLRYLSDLESYKNLPWTDRMSAQDADSHFAYVERTVFSKGGRVALVRVDCKNLTGARQKIGFSIPMWTLRCSDGTSLRNAGVQQSRIPWMLAGGMPEATLLNPNDTAGGWLGFFVPKGCAPDELTFDAPGVMAKDYGATGSIRFGLK